LRKMISTCSRDPQVPVTAQRTRAYGYDAILYAKNTPVFHLYPIEPKYRVEKRKNTQETAFLG